MKLHHIGYACHDISKSVAQVGKLYDVVSVSDVVFDEHQNATLCVIKTANGVNIELVSGTQVEGILKQGIVYYHLCYSVDDIDEEIDRLREGGAMLISDKKPAILFDNRLVAFLITTVGLIELLQE